MTQATKSCASALRGRLAGAVGLVMLAASFVGCSAPHQPTPPPPPPTPEERFERIVTALEEKLNDSAVGSADAVSSYNAPHSTPITDAKFKVKHKITPPQAEGRLPHAQLCLISEATVSVSPAPRPDDVEPSSRKRKSDDKDDLGEGMPSMESLVVPSREEAARRLGGSGLHEIDLGVTQRCFELEYRDGQWVLLTELDRENEPFNALAIQYALKKQ